MPSNVGLSGTNRLGNPWEKRPMSMGFQWIFNISTKNLTANKTYYYVVTLNDGSTITFQFGLK
jgi:hypothetical protein